jgi:hypothetical protein
MPINLQPATAVAASAAVRYLRATPKERHDLEGGLLREGKNLATMLALIVDGPTIGIGVGGHKYCVESGGSWPVLKSDDISLSTDDERAQVRHYLDLIEALPTLTSTLDALKIPS